MKTFHPRTSQFFQKWEMNSLNRNAENIRSFDQKRNQYKRLQRWSTGIYIFLISLFAAVVYISFILDIPKISIFSGI